MSKLLFWLRYWRLFSVYPLFFLAILLIIIRSDSFSEFFGLFIPVFLVFVVYSLGVFFRLRFDHGHRTETSGTSSFDDSD